MYALSVPRRSRKYRFYVILTLGTLAFYSVYFMFLRHEERVMEVEYAELRSNDPDLYLSHVRQNHGFKKYISEFQTLKGYDTPKDAVPPFVMGRWVLFDKAKRVDEAYVPPSCVDNVEIEDGQLRFSADGGRIYKVRYVVNNGKVEAEQDSGSTFEITPVAFGAHIHHIAITMPGAAQQTRYGYLCK